jgi:O-antigen ligase
VLTLTWIWGTLITLSLLGAIPFVGSQALIHSDTSPVGVRAYGGRSTILGMVGTRNTGFARYAAISALVALAGLMRKGKLVVRAIWGIAFAASMYALIIANGRTETLAFVASVTVVLVAEKARRTVNILVAITGAILLGLRGFYHQFFLYITRSGQIDTAMSTMTGRTDTWREGLGLLWKSPWVGFGFQADRYYLHIHMHNAFLHVLFQAGFLGGGAILFGFAVVWYYVVKYFFLRQPTDKSLIPSEIPAVFLFVTISSITESTFAYFSAAWLLSAPIVAYVMALHRYMGGISAKSARERAMRVALVRRNSRNLESPPEARSSTTGGRPPD